jgi:hypothetical protein
MFGPMKIDKLLEPSLKQFTSFKLTQKKEDKPHSSIVEEILGDNDLELIPNKSKFSLFGAISMALFLTDSKEEFIMKTVGEHLLDLFRTG